MVLLTALVLPASAAAAEPPTILHRPVGCALAEKFPQLEARFTPATDVAVARVVFQAQGHWYSVRMKPEGAVFTAVLPRPRKSLKSFPYYIEVTYKTLAASRTIPYAIAVVGGPSECGGELLAGPLAAASVILQGPPGVAAFPAGFASSGVVMVPGPGPTVEAGVAPAARRTDSGKTASDKAVTKATPPAAGAPGPPKVEGKPEAKATPPVAGKSGSSSARAERNRKGGIGATPLILGGLAAGGGALALGASRRGGESAVSTSGSSPASGGPPLPGNQFPSYDITFTPSLDASPCAGSPAAFDSQRVTPDASGNFDAPWPASAPIMRAVGRVQEAFQATLNCTGNSSGGAISASPAGTGEYRGAFKFAGREGLVTIRRTP